MKGRNPPKSMNKKSKIKNSAVDSSFWANENQQLINFFQNDDYPTLDSRNESGIAELIGRYEEIDHPVADFIAQLLSAVQLFSEQSNPDASKIRNTSGVSDKVLLNDVIAPLNKALTDKEKFMADMVLNKYEKETLDAADTFSVKFVSERFYLLKSADDKLFHVMQKSSLPLKGIIAEYNADKKKSVLR